MTTPTLESVIERLDRNRVMTDEPLLDVIGHVLLDEIIADLRAIAAADPLREAREVTGGKVWTCKIGPAPDEVPDGGDAPLRKAVLAAFEEMFGVHAYEVGACFSGWGGSFTDGELAVIENREPNAEHRERSNGARGPNDDESVIAHRMWVAGSIDGRLDALREARERIEMVIGWLDGNTTAQPLARHIQEALRPLLAAPPDDGMSVWPDGDGP